MNPDRYSGLSDEDAAKARDTCMAGCELLLEHAADVHYTEGPGRWQGIADDLRVDRGQFLTQGDCSSTVTWLLWNALAVNFGMRDIVNGEAWKAGYTGTLAEHGKPVVYVEDVLAGDLVLYGPGWPYLHVTMALGGGQCFSHGSEAGPFREAIDYRPDRAMIRRYI